MFGAGVAHADLKPLSGWAWSSNVAWISFNSTDSGTGGGPYKVEVDTTSNELKGFAWSKHLGWIKFDNLTSGIPAGDIPVGFGPAKVNLSTGVVSGWARACSGTVNKDCASASRTDGWDGWIELAGTNHVSVSAADDKAGVFFNNVSKFFRQYAWGGMNLGWMQFFPKCEGCVVALPLAATCSVTYEGSPAYRATWISVVNGGTPSYTYEWTVGGVALGETGSTYTKDGPTPTNYQPVLRVTDSVGASVDPNPACPPVSLTNGPGFDPSVKLWFKNAKPGEGAGPSNYYNLSKTVKEGVPVDVQYEWDDNTLTCGGVLVSGSNVGWNKPEWEALDKVNGGGFTFTGLKKGQYEFRLLCTDASLAEYTSNSGSPIKVNVTSLTYIEK